MEAEAHKMVEHPDTRVLSDGTKLTAVTKDCIRDSIATIFDSFWVKLEACLQPETLRQKKTGRVGAKGGQRTGDTYQGNFATHTPASYIQGPPGLRATQGITRRYQPHWQRAVQGPRKRLPESPRTTPQGATLDHTGSWPTCTGSSTTPGQGRIPATQTDEAPHHRDRNRAQDPSLASTHLPAVFGLTVAAWQSRRTMGHMESHRSHNDPHNVKLQLGLPRETHQRHRLRSAATPAWLLCRT
ncbi:Hypothetical predicted protein [Pelobates cultripes]|uniref:Uncharacterized protein n=1 Tax=Pelobates cultripes TaxID=61616 RepID=A0AAD1TGS6_PELCU|nr:Hypothetical predicted protein [Pelobates cultripes]